MLKEHAISYKEKLTIHDLDYIVKKANSLGRKGRQVMRVSEETDSDGSHIYFDVTGLNENISSG